MKKVLIFMTLIIVMAMVMAATLCNVAFAADENTGGTFIDETPPEINIDGPAVVGAFLVMVVLATLIESLAECVKAKVEPKTLPKWLWFCITAAMGITFCVIFGVNLLAALGFKGGTVGLYLGRAITGLAIGAGSSFVHVLLNKMRGAPALTNENTDKS